MSTTSPASTRVPSSPESRARPEDDSPCCVMWIRTSSGSGSGRSRSKLVGVPLTAHRASRREQREIAQRIEEAMDAGFVGMSSQQLQFDKLDGDRCR